MVSECGSSHQNPTTTKTTSRGTSDSGAFPGNESRLLVAGQPWRVLDSTTMLLLGTPWKTGLYQASVTLVKTSSRWEGNLSSHLDGLWNVLVGLVSMGAVLGFYLGSETCMRSSQLPCGKLISPLLVFPGGFQPVLTTSSAPCTSFQPPSHGSVPHFSTQAFCI